MIGLPNSLRALAQHESRPKQTLRRKEQPIYKKGPKTKMTTTLSREALLALSSVVRPTQPTPFQTLVSRREAFLKEAKHALPTVENWLHSTVKRGDLSKEESSEMAAKCYPIVHERALPLMEGFLKWKVQNGSPVEKRVYEGMGVIGLVDRIVKKV